MDEQQMDQTIARGVDRRRLLVAGGAAAAAAAGATVLGASPAAAAPLVPILVPVNPTRLYDSRDFGEAGRLPSGFYDTLSGSPTTNLGFLLNVTVVNTFGSGFLSVFSAEIDGTDASTINWFASNQIMVNTAYTLIRQSDSGIKVLCGGGGSTHYVLDLTGVLFEYDAGASAASMIAEANGAARRAYTATRS